MKIIESEKEAWALLQDLLRGKITDAAASEIALGDWVKLDFSITGKRYHASLTPLVMASLLSFHKSLGQSLAYAAYGKPNRQNLDGDDFENLQFDFVIAEGSSKIQVKIANGIEAVSRKIESLPPAKFLLFCVVLGLTYCGQTAIKSYFETAQTREHTKQSALETERMEMLADAYSKVYQGLEAKIIQDLAAAAYLELIDSIPDAEKASVGGVELDRKVLDLVQNRNLELYDGPREFSGTFVVEGMSNRYLDRYSLTLTQNKRRIRAHYDPREIRENTRIAILEALDRKSTLRLKIRITDRYKQKNQLTGEIESFE